MFGSLRLRVHGCSMLPSIWPGDTLVVRPADMKAISPGDIVLFAREGRLYAHRLLSISANPRPPQLITQGDALANPDPPVSTTGLLGKVSHIVAARSIFEPRTGLTPGERLMANLVRHSGWAARFLVHLHSSRHNPFRSEDQ